jgi:hypothetical protein
MSVLQRAETEHESVLALAASLPATGSMQKSAALGPGFRSVAGPATGEPLLLWLWSGSKQKPTGAIKQHPTCLVVRESGSAAGSG